MQPIENKSFFSLCPVHTEYKTHAIQQQHPYTVLQLKAHSSSMVTYSSTYFHVSMFADSKSQTMPRKDELEAEQRMLEKRLEKLKLQQQSCPEPNCSEQFEREARGLQKKIVNAKMRLRSIKIKSLEKGRVSPQASFNSYPVKKSMSDDVNLTEIDANDEEFDPTQYNFVHERPVTRLLPDIPLPHSSLLWEKTRYVAKWIHTLDAESLLSGKMFFRGT